MVWSMSGAEIRSVIERGIWLHFTRTFDLDSRAPLLWAIRSMEGLGLFLTRVYS